MLLTDGSHLPADDSAFLSPGQTLRVGDLFLTVKEVLSLPSRGTIHCTNSTCNLPVDAGLKDCPWCGTSLAFASTQAPR